MKKKRFRFTITRKIILVFSVLMLLVIGSNYFIFQKVTNNSRVNQQHINVYTPSAQYLDDLLSLINTSQMLIKNWVYIEKKENTPDKIRLQHLHDEEFPEIKEQLTPLSKQWDEKTREKYETILHNIDTLFQAHQTIMTSLNSFSAYEDPVVFFEVESMVSQGGEVSALTGKITRNLEELNAAIVEKVEASNQQMQQSFLEVKQFIVGSAIAMGVAVFMFALLTSRALVVPLRHIRKILFSMSKGILPENNLKERSDEIGDMSAALNLLINGLRQTSEFSLQIGKGNFSSDFRPLSENDVLGNSLIRMRENLKKAEEEEAKRKKEDQQRSWATQGVAKFGEILRQNNDNLEELSYNIISEMVKYLDSNQGGLFILNDEEKDNIFIELKAAYAYDRRKYLEKRIEVGITLVGQCVQEGQTIYLTDVPNDYIRITSGLGEENPTALLIVPLKMNDQVYGVIELASFREYERYQINFVEKISETIASTISNVKINQNTARLLKESQEISEQMAQQEEEMRQNVEEMQATQEELVKQQEDERKRQEDLKQEYKEQIRSFQKKIQEQNFILSEQQLKNRNISEAINNSIGKAELDIEGKYIKANKKYLKMTGIPLEELKEKNISQFLHESFVNSAIYQLFWSKIATGNTMSETHQYFFNEKERWFHDTFTPVRSDENQDYDQIVVLSFDLTKLKRKEDELYQQIEHADRQIEQANAEIEQAYKEIEQANNDNPQAEEATEEE